MNTVHGDKELQALQNTAIRSFFQALQNGVDEGRIPAPLPMIVQQAKAKCLQVDIRMPKIDEALKSAWDSAVKNFREDQKK